ncbi:hypothetical protein BH20CHL2_BH20CHL2_13240 [soil metagenome]|jgi:hypothetical protein
MPTNIAQGPTARRSELLQAVKVEHPVFVDIAHASRTPD